MYTIGQVSRMCHLPISTLRYYDREGLFRGLKRTSGIRRFEQSDIDRLHVIECLKKSGLEIKDIRQFIEWCDEGPATYGARLNLFHKQKAAVDAEIERMEQVRAMIEFKCWYYEQAIADGNEERLKAMKPDGYPPEIQRLYDYSQGSAAASKLQTAQTAADSTPESEDNKQKRLAG